MAIDKRKALQPVLDSIEKGWQITKPSPLNPNDLETECIFQHRVKGHKQIRIVIDNGLYRLSNLSELQDVIRSVKPGPEIYRARFTVQPESLNFTARSKSRNVLHI